MEFFSRSNDLLNIFCDTFRSSDEETKICLFKLYYSWKHFISKEILDTLKHRLNLDKFQEKIKRERPEIIERYDRYNEEVEKKRKDAQIQQQLDQQNQEMEQRNELYLSETNPYNINTVNNLNNNNNMTSHYSSQNIISHGNISGPNFHLGNQIQNQNQQQSAQLVTSTSNNSNKEKLNKAQNYNINANNPASAINSNIESNFNSSQAKAILLGKTALNQSLLPSITNTRKNKHKDADYLFSSGSSNNNSDNEEKEKVRHAKTQVKNSSNTKNGNNSIFNKKRNLIESENDKEIQVMRDVAIKKRKIEDNLSSDSNSVPELGFQNLGGTNSNYANIGNISGKNNLILNNNSTNISANMNINSNINSLNASNVQNLIHSNILPNNINNIPIGNRNNIFPYQQLIYQQGGNLSNLPGVASGQVNNLNFNYLNQNINNLANFNQLAAVAAGRKPFNPIMQQQNNILFSNAGNIPNILGANNPNINNIINRPPDAVNSILKGAVGAQPTNLLFDTMPNFMNNIPPNFDNNQALNFTNLQNNSSSNNLGLISTSAVNNQIANTGPAPAGAFSGESGVNNLTNFISKSNVSLNPKMAFFSGLAKWFYDSILEDNPLNDIQKENTKIKTIYDLIKIKDFTEKESYKDLFKRVFNSFYSDVKNNCAVCGFRTSQYKRFVEHLDIHFHINFIKKNSQKKDLYRRESLSKNSWITNTDSNLNLGSSNNLNLNKKENLNSLTTLNSVLYYLTDSEIHLNSNKNNLGPNEGENNENMIFPVQKEELKCIYCKEDFKKKYFNKYHFWFYINVNKLNYEELKIIGQNQNLSLTNDENRSFNNSNKYRDEDEEDKNIALIHNTCLDEFINMIIIMTNKKQIEQVYQKAI